VEIAVVETGLGGRLDASNVLTPEMTITTDISRDHVEILGSSIRKIAREKAGIIKPGVPHLIGMLPEPAADVMRQRCTQLKAPLYKLTGGNVSFHPEAMSLDFRHNGLAIRGLKPSLVGVYQLKNTALALKAVAILRNRGWRVSKRAIVEGIRGAVWPGRFEIREYRGKPTHIFDVSHNASGVASFVETYKLIFGERKAKIITGFVKRKEHQKMFDSLSTIAESYALVPLRTGRSVELSEMVSSINWRGVPYRRHGSLKSAYSKVLNSSANDDVVIVIGSHYLVGEFYNWYKRR
jgi:dihydrofolate synthase/folylpolyglutamate synthase